MNSLPIYEASWETDWQFSLLGPTMAWPFLYLEPGPEEDSQASHKPQNDRKTEHCLSEHSKEKHGISDDQTASPQM